MKRTNSFLYCIPLGFLLAIANEQNVLYSQEGLQPKENQRIQQSVGAQEKNTWIEFKNLKNTLRKASPGESARLIRELVEKYKLNADYRPELPREIDPLQVEVNQTLFRAGEGLEKGIEERVSRAELESVPELRKIVAEEPTVVLIQLSRNISLRERLVLLDSDVKIYEEKALTFIARLPIGVIRSVANLPFVRWIGEFKSEYKYPVDRPLSLKKSVFIYPLDEGTAEHENDLRSLGVRIEKYSPRENVYTVDTNESEFQRIAELCWVRWIEREPMITGHGVYFEPDDSRQIISSYKSSYDGTGVRIGVMDDGLWNGNVVDFPTGSIFTLGNFGGTNSPHGTHVTGIIAARGRESTYRGVAPSSTIFFGPWGQGFDHKNAFKYFHDNSVIASNHSWGFSDLSIKYSYSDQTREIDGYADDGDIVVVSAGNDGPTSPTIGNPAIGKNVITVGAIQYAKNSGLNYQIGDVANYSSRGPTQGDSRLKPDIVAPGGSPFTSLQAPWPEGVVSTNRDPWEIRDSQGNIILQGNIGDNQINPPEWPNNDWYIRMSGTSMAAPHVTGIAAKALQWDPNLRSHTFKATLINNAIPIKANSNTPLSGYANTNVGYGLANAFSITNYYEGEEQQLLFVGDGLTTILNAENNYTITVPSGAKKLCVTLAYDDEEGTTSSTVYIKDNLDLFLFSPTTCYQYVKPSGVTGESPVEKIVIENPVSGNWTVRVKFINPGVFSSQVFAVHAKVILKNPAISVTASPATIYKDRAQSLDITPTVTNSGGYIAAGVNLEISSSPTGFSGDISTNKYVDNLMYQNASASKTFSLTTPSADGSYTLNIVASGINLGLGDASTQVTVVVDGTAPPAPISLAATPNGWTNTNSFSINWTNPVDLSGVVAAWYKLGSPPTSSTDGIHTTDKPFTVSATATGGQVIYVWFEDRLGNRDHNNRASTTLYYTGVSTSIAVTASLNPSNTTISQTVNVSGGAIYNTGNPVTSGTVTIEIIGGNSWTTTLDANGNFNRNITAPATPGNYTVRTTVSDGTKSGFVDNNLSVSGGQGNPNAYQFYRATVCEDVQSSTPYDPINETRWIRSTFARVNVWVHLTDLYKSVRVKWEWYKSDGSLWNTTYSSWTDDPATNGYLYWYWWKLWSNWTVSGTNLADMEGEWSVKVYVEENGGSLKYHDTQYFTIRYNLTEHKMAQDVQSSDPYLPINPTNTFYQTDSKALTWMNLDDVAEGLQIRWDYYEPNGSLYNSFSYTVPDPGSGYYYPWYRLWGWINVTGNAAASKTGNWRVEVFIKDPFNNYDREYTDYFRILESPNVPPTISDGSLTSAIEGASVEISISVTDNGYLQKVELYWTDQTQHNTILADNILSNSFANTYSIGPYTEGVQVHYSVRAYDVAGNVAESPQRTITILDSDTQGPEIANLKAEEYYGNGDGVIQDIEQVKISWSISDPSGIQSVTLLVDNQSKSVVNNTYSISGPYTVGTHETQITATDNDYSPSSSNLLTNFTIVASIPSTATSLTVSVASSSQIDLSWQDNATNEAGYKVERKIGASGTYSEIASLSAGTTSYSDTGLTDGTRYYYRVYAYNSAGNSGYSNESDGITPMNAPTSLIATATSSSQINLSWQDNSSSESDYRIERKIDVSGAYSEIATVGANVTTFDNTGLTENTHYYYRVQGYNSLINSSYSNEANVTTPVPVEISIFNAEATNTKVQLEWRTETEIDNYGFEIERKTFSELSERWNKIGFVAGSGTSNSPHSYSYIDRNLTPGHYAYRLKQIDNCGSFEYYGNAEVEVLAPTTFVLEQNYPNPFNPSTVIRYALPSRSLVRLEVFDPLGRNLQELVNFEQDAGYHEVTWQPSVPSGIYFYRIEAVAVDNPKERFVKTRKLLLIQ